jgi:small ligand-binding sensory domain FIST
MPFAASHTTLSDSRRAGEQVCKHVSEQLRGRHPDVAVLFVSAHHAECEELPQIVQDELGPRHLIGCTCETVIGGSEELEGRPALSLWAASLPGVAVHSFHFGFERTPDGLVCLGLPTADEFPSPTTAIVLGEPFSCAADSLMARLTDEYPGLPLVGGMASGAASPGENRLYWGGQSLHQGGVGLLLGDGVEVRSVVSQGCRPVGPTFIATRADRNVLHELGGRPAMQCLQDVFDAAPPRDRELLQKGPHVGVAINPSQAEFRRGDFLIANVIGGDRNSGALALGNMVRTGQTVQFHVRDATAADEDLHTLLTESLRSGASPEAALLFSCNGRGTRMFPQPHHDAQVIQQLAGPLPLAGFFAMGEIGPVGGANHLHGFTASVALFSAAGDRRAH